MEKIQLQVPRTIHYHEQRREPRKQSCGVVSIVFSVTDFFSISSLLLNDPESGVVRESRSILGDGSLAAALIGSYIKNTRGSNGCRRLVAHCSF
jgi:hypothetical protein